MPGPIRGSCVKPTALVSGQCNPSPVTPSLKALTQVIWAKTPYTCPGLTRFPDWLLAQENYLHHSPEKFLLLGLTRFAGGAFPHCDNEECDDKDFRWLDGIQNQYKHVSYALGLVGERVNWPAPHITTCAPMTWTLDATICLHCSLNEHWVTQINQ